MGPRSNAAQTGDIERFIEHGVYIERHTVTKERCSAGRYA